MNKKKWRSGFTWSVGRYSVEVVTMFGRVSYVAFWKGDKIVWRIGK